MSLPFDVFVRSRLRTYFSSTSGYLEDRDYLNGTSAATNYSRSDAHLDGGLFAEITAGMRLPLLQGLVISPLVGWNHFGFNWHAEGGYYQYPTETAPPYSEWDPGSPKFALYGTSIAYRVASSFGTMGFQGFLSFRDLNIDLVASGSWRIESRDVDTHYRRLLTFTDTYSGGKYLVFGTVISYRITEASQVFLSSDFRRLWGFEGSISTLDMNSGENTAAETKYSSGLDIMLVDWAIGIRFET